MNEIQNTDTLTAEILILKQQTAHNIMEIGKRLISVKESLPHGEWGKYLKEKVDFSQVTANKFMKISEEYSNLKAPLDLGSEKLWLLLEVPSEERGEFVQANDVEAMSTRDLQQAIKDKKDLEAKLIESKEFVIKAHELARIKGEERDKAIDEKFNAESTLRTTDEVFRKTQKKCDSLEKLLHLEKEKSEERLKNLDKIIAENRKSLSEAKASGDDEEVTRLQVSLKESQKDLDSSAKKIDELEAQLEAKHIDVITAEPVIIEKVPEAIEKELAELRKNIGQGSSQSDIKFKIYYADLQSVFNNELKVMDDTKETDPKTYEKYKNAILNLINKMSERL